LFLHRKETLVPRDWSQLPSLWTELHDVAKFGKYCQKSLLSKTFANFWQYFFIPKHLPFFKHQL